MKKTIAWSYFPKTDPIPKELEEIIGVFEKNFQEINTVKDEEKITKGVKDIKDRLQSDDILKIVEKDFLDLNFKIETDKKKSNKINVFTTRPDTIFGASFIAVSVDHPIAKTFEKNKNFISFKSECSKMMCMKAEKWSQALQHEI